MEPKKTQDRDEQYLPPRTQNPAAELSMPADTANPRYIMINPILAA